MKPWTERPDDLRSIQTVSEELGKHTIMRRGIICRVSNPHPLEDGTEALPLARA
jgi:hypothetical protein